MLEDTFDSMDDQEELEDAAQEEVEKILFEVTNGKIYLSPSISNDAHKSFKSLEYDFLSGIENYLLIRYFT